MLKITKELIENVIKDIKETGVHKEKDYFGTNGVGEIVSYREPILYFRGQNIAPLIMELLDDLLKNFSEYINNEKIYNFYYKMLSSLYLAYYRALRSLKGIVDETEELQKKLVESSSYNIFFIDNPTPKLKRIVLDRKDYDMLVDTKKHNGKELFTEEEVIKVLKEENVTLYDLEGYESINPRYIVEVCKNHYGKVFFNEEKLCQNLKVFMDMYEKDRILPFHRKTGARELDRCLWPGAYSDYMSKRSLKNLIKQRKVPEYGEAILFLLSLPEDEYSDLIACLIWRYTTCVDIFNYYK